MRTAHFLDIENLCGNPTAFGAVHVAAEYRDLVRVQHGDQIVVGASSSQAAFAGRQAFPGAQLVYREGQDGADNALVDFARSELDVLAGRFDTIVIGSGDHAFAPLARELAAVGLTVVVVAIPRTISGALTRSVDRIVGLAEVMATDNWVTAA